MPPAAAPAAAPAGAPIRSLAVLTDEILGHLGRMEEAPAAQLISEALGLYTVEQVVEDLAEPALREVGERWLRGDWTVAQEHFASAFFRGRVANLLHASPFNSNGPLVIVACAPEELHEIGAQILSLYLRRAGFRVVYLGQNVPLDSLVSMARALRPAVICCSASRPDTAGALRPLAGMIDEMERQADFHPVLAFGGAVFNRHPGLAEQMRGVYLGRGCGRGRRERAPAYRLTPGPSSPYTCLRPPARVHGVARPLRRSRQSTPTGYPTILPRSPVTRMIGTRRMARAWSAPPSPRSQGRRRR